MSKPTKKQNSGTGKSPMKPQEGKAQAASQENKGRAKMQKQPASKAPDAPSPNKWDGIDKKSGRNQASKPGALGGKDGYLWSMSHSPRIDGNTSWFQMLPAAFFTAACILLVRMHTYNRPMEKFFWSTDTIATSLSDFFSYVKMTAILACAAVTLAIVLYRLFTQSLAIKRCFAYIPMAVYSLMVLLSYAFSEYKEFSLLGWNDRFEGTLVLLSYMVMLFFIINSVNTEKNVKWITIPLVISSTILSLIGFFQSIDMDPFRTALGQKLIVPNLTTESGTTAWQLIDNAAAVGERYLNFTFQNKEIYQTVYNINYVSFYLTLLIPLFGMLFIRSVNKGDAEGLWKKIGWGLLFALQIYNLIGSASSGGFLGLGVVGLLGIIILNKRLLKWWKPVAMLLVITISVGGATYSRWLPEITQAIGGVLEEDIQAPQGEASPESAPPGSIKPVIDYIKTNARSVEISVNGNLLTLNVEAGADGVIDSLSLADGDGKALPMAQLKTEDGVYSIEDPRFRPYLTLSYGKGEQLYYAVVSTPGLDWPFAIKEDQIYYQNQLGRMVNLREVPHIGWENNPHFGSWRGYIWSRTLPLMKDTALIGYGADTYAAHFPQGDYAGKYTTQFEYNLNVIVDKPHNMYLGMWTGTGGLSVLAFLALWLIYAFQSVKLYFRNPFENDYLVFAGSGIFFGIIGFAVSGLVNDSTVSTMPMFYGLLGLGIAINLMLEKAGAN